MIKQTVLAAAFVNEIKWRPPPERAGERDLGVFIDEAVRCLTETIDETSGTSSDSFGGWNVVNPPTYQATNDPPVPLLLLAAAGDVVVPLETTEK